MGVDLTVSQHEIGSATHTKVLVGAFSVITNLRMELFGALVHTVHSRNLDNSVQLCVLISHNSINQINCSNLSIVSIHCIK